MMNYKTTIRVIMRKMTLLLIGLIILVPGFYRTHLNAGSHQTAGIMFSGSSSPGVEGRVYFPLKKTDVRISVVTGIVSTQVTQVFRNDTKHALEAVYIFPLPARAAVTDMVLQAGERIIKSEIHERQKAKQIFQKARAAGKKTALLEQNRSNLFTTTVANFLPGEMVSIQLTYMETVQYNKGKYSVNFPMVVGQRYLAPSQPLMETIAVNPPLLHPNMDSGHRLAIQVDIAGIPVRQIKSSTHQVLIEEVSRQDNKFRVSLAKQVTIPDCDFNLDILVEKQEKPHFSYIHSSQSKESYGLLTIFPPLKGDEETAFTMPRDVVFLVDTSGSMSGDSMAQARAGLTQCLDMLRAEDRFTIVRFSNDYSYFNSGLQQASQENLSGARHYINGLIGNGGTLMQPALEFVLNIPQKEGHMPMIVFLTDGAVGNEDSLFRLLTERLGQKRLFTFGIGSAPNEHLMRKMAEIGRGQSRFIRSTENVGDVMADFFKTLEAPVLTDISLSWKDTLGNDVQEIEYYPNPCADVFSGRPLQVVVKHRRGSVANVVISGNYAGRQVEYEYPLTGEEISIRSVQRMFGRKKISRLMCRLLRADVLEEIMVKGEIVQVSLKHQVLSRFTARVAVEERVTRNPQGKLETVKVKVPLPKGWNAAMFHATATKDTTWFLTGMFLIVAGLIILLVRRM